jgi:hypothetical protein
MSVDKRKCERCEGPCKHGGAWYYFFSIRGKRYRKAIPEARTKAQAEQAEARAKDAIYRGRYSDEASDITLKEFVENSFCPGRKTIRGLGRTTKPSQRPFSLTSGIGR